MEHIPDQYLQGLHLDGTSLRSSFEWCIDDMDDAECVEQYGVTLEQFRGLISKMAYRMRKYLDNDDGWSDLRDYAIRKIIYEELCDKTVI